MFDINMITFYVSSVLAYFVFINSDFISRVQRPVAEMPYITHYINLPHFYIRSNNIHMLRGKK